MVLFVTKEMFRLVHISKRRVALCRFHRAVKSARTFGLRLKSLNLNQQNGNDYLERDLCCYGNTEARRFDIKWRLLL